MAKPIFRPPDEERAGALAGYRGRRVKLIIDDFRSGRNLDEVVGEAIGVTWMAGAASQYGITIMNERGALTCYPGARIRSIEEA
jgi:hypothetical protein